MNQFFSSSAIGSIVYSWVTFTHKSASSTVISKKRKGKINDYIYSEREYIFRKYNSQIFAFNRVR